MIIKKYNFSYTSSFKKKIFFPKTLDQLNLLLKKKFIIIGNLRSYNDSIISNGRYISLSKFNKITDFDKKKKIIEVESGQKLHELNKIILKENLFLPCTPGCKYVSIGGMVANNISGKLLLKNSLRSHIISIKILDKKNNIVECSKNKNKKLFYLTIGGRGRTGPIISAKFKLEKIQSNVIYQKNYAFNDFIKFNKSLPKLKQYKYAVCWLDFTKENFDGIIFAGKHVEKDERINYQFFDFKLTKILVILVSLFVNTKFLTIFFNFLFKLKNQIKQKNLLTYNNYFFPQNRIINWNEFFKKQGFIQFHVYVEKKRLLNLVNFIKADFVEQNLFSNFSILKFHNNHNLNYQKFSLSLDIPINKNIKLIKTRLNFYIEKFDLEVDLAKDMSMKKLNKKTLNTNSLFKISNFKFVNINFDSSLIKRLQDG
ncbi:FAD-binding oxidoreductase [Candidatus Pelagibacter communis]|jgi:decaprenylphospho-beta-D-ribofuranose 2-oxidase|uniref:FAD-binding oxidoreductase n=1 Tax=Pelagibacter ubique TaxID=198252 RepID=UPI000368A479|nr:FAD-binding oxidoreductase [Candidatus Pelagibacter ubique]